MLLIRLMLPLLIPLSDGLLQFGSIGFHAQHWNACLPQLAAASSRRRGPGRVFVARHRRMPQRQQSLDGPSNLRLHWSTMWVWCLIFATIHQVLFAPEWLSLFVVGAGAVWPTAFPHFASLHGAQLASDLPFGFWIAGHAAQIGRWHMQLH